MAAIWSPWLKHKHSVFEHLFHITDWLPTLYTAAGDKFCVVFKIFSIGTSFEFINRSIRTSNVVYKTSCDKERQFNKKILKGLSRIENVIIDITK